MKDIEINQNEVITTYVAFKDVVDGRIRTKENDLISRNIKWKPIKT